MWTTDQLLHLREALQFEDEIRAGDLAFQEDADLVFRAAREFAEARVEKVQGAPTEYGDDVPTIWPHAEVGELVKIIYLDQDSSHDET